MIDLIASRKHYWDHLVPVWRRLPPEQRGTAYLDRSFRAVDPHSQPLGELTTATGHVMVASFDDLRLAKGRAPILFEHGIGQSYAGSRESAYASGYAGGTGRGDVAAFLHPNEYSAARDRDRYPGIPVEVVGSPLLAELQQIPVPPMGIPTVAVSFHWHGPLCSETSSGFGHWWAAVKALAASREVEVLGHGHPRLLPDITGVYRRAGIEVVPSFTEILKHAHCFVFDNTSAGFYFAAARGPVVVLDNPGYRTHVNHGLRFWDCADIGPRIQDPADLPDAIQRSLDVSPGADRILSQVFPAVEDPAGMAANAVLHVANQPQKALISR